MHGAWVLSLACLIIPADKPQAADAFDRRVGDLVERLASRDRAAVQAALDELGSLGDRALPSIIRRLDDRREVNVGLVSIATKGPNAFEALAAYRPLKVVDCLCILIGGGFLHNGGTEAERSAFVGRWRSEALGKVGGQAERDGLRPGKPVVAVTLQGDEITDLSMSYVKALPDLERLTLEGSNLTDSLLEQVGAVAGLKELKLKGSHVTEAGIAGLQRALPKLRIEGR
jgi:hypothetical protein